MAQNQPFTLQSFGGLNLADNPADFNGVEAKIAEEWIIEGKGFIRSMQGRQLFVQLPDFIVPITFFFYDSHKGTDTLYIISNGLLFQIRDFITVDSNNDLVIDRFPSNSDNTVVNYSQTTTGNFISNAITLTEDGFNPQELGFTEGDFIFRDGDTEISKIISIDDIDREIFIDKTFSVSTGSTFRILKAMGSKNSDMFRVGESVIIIQSYATSYRIFEGKTRKLLYSAPTLNLQATVVDSGTKVDYTYAITFSSDELIFETAPAIFKFNNGDTSTVTLNLFGLNVPEEFDKVNVYRLRFGIESVFKKVGELDVSGLVFNPDFPTGKTGTVVDDFTIQLDDSTIFSDPTFDRINPGNALIGAKVKNGIAIANILTTETTNKNTIHFSLPIRPNDIEARDFHVIAQDGGEILGIIEIDIGLIVFRDKDIWLLRGNVGTLSQTKIHDAGIKSVSSFVKINNIVFFVSELGSFVTNGSTVKQVGGESFTRFIRDKLTEKDRESIVVSEKLNKVLVMI